MSHGHCHPEVRHRELAERTLGHICSHHGGNDKDTQKKGKKAQPFSYVLPTWLRLGWLAAWLAGGWVAGWLVSGCMLGACWVAGWLAGWQTEYIVATGL